MNKKTKAYLSLFFVVLVWGTSPLFTLDMYKYYSPTARLVFAEIVSLTAYIAVSWKKRREYSLDYIKVGIPTGCFMTLANMSQKIGLLYTTPARYAFLENLICISVPIIMFVLVKKKPSFMTVMSSLVCLVSVFVLNGISFGEGSSWGVGEILCAAAGLLYGFNIAGTSVFAKKLYPPLYLATQSAVALVIYSASMIVFDKLSLVNGEPIESIKISFEPAHLLYVAVLALIISVLCWTLRTNAMKYVEASVVSIIMPFAAVVTSVISIILGKDTLSINIVGGGLLGMLAIFLSTYDDIFKAGSDYTSNLKV